MSLGAGAARRRMSSVAAALSVLALAACASKTVCTPAGTLANVAPPPDWRDAVTDPDHVKLRALRARFLDGLAQARGAGFAAPIDSEGRLFNPDFAQDGVALKPGAYRCRSFRLGPAAAQRPAFVALPAGRCTIEEDGRLQDFTEQDGPQRLSGRIYPDEPARSVFLGTRSLPDEATALHYGRDVDRDTVGALQRVGDARWRIAVPAPAWGASIEIIELTPTS